ncbi:MAG: restriction endonuclease [Blastocatellia bacterium]|nr:restriction endonuclease [Blastocatellia bacterium]
MNWQLPEPIHGVSFTIESDGVWLRSLSNLKACQANNRLGRLLPSLIPQLIELGLAEQEGDQLKIPHHDFARFEAEGIDAFENVAEWSPFTLEIKSYGALGLNDFRYLYRFYYGAKLVDPKRLGSFVRQGQTIYRLDRQTFALIEAIEQFNALPFETKQGTEAYLQFSTIKGLAEGTGAEIDRYVSEQRVLIPTQIGLDIIDNGEGRISFAPRIDGAPPEAMWQAFIARNGIDEVYSLDHATEGRVYVVLNEQQREVLRRMQKVRRLGGADKTKVLREPQAVFDGAMETLDLSDYGPRVKGIGDFPFIAQPYYRANTGIFDDIEREPHQRNKNFSAGLQCRYADGSTDDVQFASRQEIFDFHREAQEAFRSGKSTVELQGKSILVDQTFIQALGELVAQVSRKPAEREKEEEKARRYLLIHNNDAELEYNEGTAELKEEGGDQFKLELPKSLKPSIELKPHQRDGVAWLQRNYLLGNRGRRGCLLADDMGLGKTLQSLTFLAWLIERGDIAANTNPDLPPFKPVLIVAPLILIENETWLNDMKTFFVGDGALFLPCLVLRDKKLKELRISKGKETERGQPALDLEQLRTHRVILTNYETIVSYQHSFARMDWSVVITDEAQEYKTTNTKISHALKGLNPRFRVAATGTPVETRLGDVWNLFDFLQPGPLLGSATEFRKEYETPLQETDNANEVLTKLKTRLRFNRPDAYLLRRDKKTSLPGLPLKHEHSIPCDLSPQQRQMHFELLGRASAGEHPLQILPKLQKLYQHPALLPRYEGLRADEALQQSPKLQAVVKRLKEIRLQHEKALIFTRTLDMQQLLVSVLNETFGLDVDIINGATTKGGEVQDRRRTRQTILKRFRESKGFNVLILSPDVAGIGLTITEANHVIHYGRWWNPAKESQATDRVYRIGQEREVHVYHPISRDPQGKFETFDEKLDQLIRQRIRLAADFLAPMPQEENLGNYLFDTLLGSARTSSPTVTPQPLTMEDVRRFSGQDFEALVAAMEQRSGKKVILTPQSSDGGIDVISLQENEVRLIQCKHRQWDSKVNDDVVTEAVTAFDGYRAKYLRRLRQGIVMRIAVITNGEFTKAALKSAKDRDIQMMAYEELEKRLVSTKLSQWDVNEMLEKRCASMRDVSAALVELATQR